MKRSQRNLWDLLSAIYAVPGQEEKVKRIEEIRETSDGKELAKMMQDQRPDQQQRPAS